MDSLSQDESKTLLGLASVKVKEVSEALERNWLIQMTCAAIGVALVYDIGGLPKLICKYFGQDSCSTPSAGIILLVVNLYYFMKFGQLVTAFLEARSLFDQTLRLFLGERTNVVKLAPLQDSLSFFEGYYSPEAFASWAPLRIAYFALFLLVVASGQASAMFLLLRGYRLSGAAVAVGSAASLSLFVLYVGFWLKNREHANTTLLVWACVALVVATFCLMWATGN